jgi:sugar O-acyltransferase (sialic acid O-acetyltransferase NeuD family)
MNRLIIVGAGGFGREVLAWALDIPSNKRDWDVFGFLDDDPSALERFSVPYPVLGSTFGYHPKPDDRFVCAIGTPNIKLRICDELENRGARFITLIHPSAIIGTRCEIGLGTVVCPGVILTSDVKIGKHVLLNLHVTVGHDATIEDGSILSPHVDITGFAKIGRGVILGAHAVVLPKAKVDNDAIVGAGSVVLKRVKSGTTVMGVPAKQIAGF